MIDFFLQILDAFPHFVLCIPKSYVFSWETFKTLKMTDLAMNQTKKFDFQPTIFDAKARAQLGFDTIYGLCMHANSTISLEIDWNQVTDIDVFLTTKPEGHTVGYQKFSMTSNMTSVLMYIKEITLFDQGQNNADKYPDFVMENIEWKKCPWMKYYDTGICLHRCVQLKLHNSSKLANEGHKCVNLHNSLKDQMLALCSTEWQKQMMNICQNNSIGIYPNYKLCNFSDMTPITVNLQDGIVWMRIT